MRGTGRPKVAVIGSGLAGLTSAYLLVKEGCEVYLVEKSDKLGFHSSSVEVPLPQEGKSKGRKDGGRPDRWVVDVPMRSFQGGYYPLLISLYKHLQIPIDSTHFTFSFSHLITSTPHARPSEPRDRPSTYFLYNGGSGVSLPALSSRYLTSPLGIIRGLWTLVYMALGYIILLFVAFLSWHDLLPGHLGAPSATLYDLLEYIRPIPYKWFVDDILIPVFSAVGTMTSLDVLTTPLPALLGYVHATVGTPHYALAKGHTAADVASRLCKPIQAQGPGHVVLGTEITDLRKVADKVEVIMGDERIRVDKLVIAAQASAAIALLGSLQTTLKGGELHQVQEMRAALAEVEYRETIVITHRDHSILSVRSDTRAINLTTPVVGRKTGQSVEMSTTSTPSLTTSVSSTQSTYPSTPTNEEHFPLAPYFTPFPNRIYTMGTHIISPPRHIQNQGVGAVLQTTNPVIPIDPSSILAIATLERALPLRDLQTLDRLRTGNDRPSSIYLVGSYAYPGIPLLEGCVGSAKQAVESIVRSNVSRHDTALEAIGGIDWNAGQGGRLSRLWRYRWK